MQPLFDIAGDLDTPVSAFMKLGAFAPRFLLESVEGGERLARYSFIGFGDGLEVRLDETGFRIGVERRPVPRSREELLAGLRAALALAPKPEPDISGVPLAGGLVGYAAYDVVRYLRAAARALRSRERCAGAALRRAALAAGVRSPDPRHRAAARRPRGGAARAAARGHARAARRTAAGPARRPLCAAGCRL